MFLLFTIKSELKSALSLGYQTYTSDTIPGSVEDYKNKLVIRWGNSNLLGYDFWGDNPEFDNVANPSKAIQLNCTKNKSRAVFGKVVRTAKEFKVEVPNGKYAVIRPFSHSAGKDFKVVRGPHKISSGYYATEFIKTDTEYRVWFANGKTFAGQRVALNGESHDKPCRSNWGYSYRSVAPDLHKDTLAAARSIGLTFGAADVLIDRGRPLFLELNSAPSIDAPSVRSFYQEAIEEYAQSRGF